MLEEEGIREPNGRVAIAGKGERPMLGLAGSARKSAADPRHERAINRAGAVRLAHAIRPYGVLRKDVLAEVAGAGRWSAGAFQNALDAAVELGLLQHVALGFYQASPARASTEAAPEQAGPH